MGFFDKVKNAVKSFVNDEFLQAITASCALVAYADGDCSAEEKKKMLQYMKLNEDLKHFRLSQIEEHFERFSESIAFDYSVGQIECFKAVEAIADNRDNAEKMVAVCLAVAKVDGVMDKEEAEIIKQIAKRAGFTNTSRFGV